MLQVTPLGMEFAMLLILRLKRVTERTLPWGSPNSWSCGLERTVPFQTRKCRFEIKLAMKMGKWPLIPRSYRSCIMPYRHVMSYAFSRSKNTATACCFLMKALRSNVSNLTRWSRVDRPRLKLHWYSEMRWSLSSVQMRRSLTILSMVLQMQLVKAIAR